MARKGASPLVYAYEIRKYTQLTARNPKRTLLRDRIFVPSVVKVTMALWYTSRSGR